MSGLPDGQGVMWGWSGLAGLIIDNGPPIPAAAPFVPPVPPPPPPPPVARVITTEGGTPITTEGGIEITTES